MTEFTAYGGLFLSALIAATVLGSGWGAAIDDWTVTHSIQFSAAPDDIRPEIIISNPQIGFGPTEASDFTLAFSAFDNVKIESLEVFRTSLVFAQRRSQPGIRRRRGERQSMAVGPL